MLDRAFGAFPRALVLDVADREPEQFHDRVVGREVASVLDDLAELQVEALERPDREVKRRTVVGIFPNSAALCGSRPCVLIEAHDEWRDSDRRYLSEESMALLNPPEPTLLEPKESTSTKTTRRQIAATA